MLNNGQKAVIHVAKKQVGMSEEEYRSMLSGFGVASSKDLSFQGFKAVMTHFEKLGFVSTYAKKPKPKSSKERLLRKVYAVRNALGWSEKYVDKIAKRMFGKSDSHRWLDANQLHKLVANLVSHQRKLGR